MEKQKNIPQLRFPEFEGEWEKKKLGEISSGVMYGMNAAAKEYDGVHKYIRITDIDENSREFCPNPLSSPDEKPDRRYKLKTGDIVFVRTGASVGKSYLYKEEDGDLYFAGFLIRFTINKANPFFVYTQTLLRPYDKWIKIMSMRSGQPGVNAEEFKTLNLSFPSLPEQQKIASFFTAIDQKISQLKQKKTLLELYKEGVMQKIFSQEIRFKDNNGQEFPKWEKKKLKDVAEIKYGKDQKGIACENGQYPILGTGGVMGRTNEFLSDKPSVLIGRKGTIDKPLFIDTPFWTVDTLFYTNLLSNVNAKWLYYNLTKVNWYKYNEASGVPSLSTSTINKIPINLPSLGEQTRIANFLSAIDDKISHTQKQIEKAEVLKKGLMQQMFV